MVPTIIDRRGDLPVHKTREFGLLDPSLVEYIVLHQQNGTGPLENVALYHVNPNHISKRGCPGFCYHYHIALDGTISQANDLTRAVWSSGKVKSYRAPSPNKMRFLANMNKKSISIMLQGDFDAIGHKGYSGDPTDAQFRAVTRLRHFLLEEFSLPASKFIGHCHVNKKACPGFTAQAWVEDMWEMPRELYIPEPHDLQLDMEAFLETIHNPFLKFTT